MMRTTFAVPAAIAQAVQAAQDFTWTAHAAAGAGTYSGQRRRIISGVGNQPFWLTWDAANSVWDPEGGRQLYYVGAVVTDTNSTATKTLTFPTVAHPAAFFRAGTGCEVDMLGECTIAATARTCVWTLGSEDLIAITTSTDRRLGGIWGFISDSATTQWCYIKKASNERNWQQSDTGNVGTIAQTVANALNITGSATFTTAASAGTATLRRYKLYLVKG